MTSGIIDESAIAEALRLTEPGEGIKRLLRLQGLGLWHGDLSEMRGDVPRRPSTEPPPASAEAKEMMRHIKMVRQLRTALDRLPSEGREALYLRYYESLPIEAIADRLGMKTSQAAALIDGALQHVSKIYVDEF
jgi:DNA-directed RNA polymerase specialized sigma24 family protein